MGNLFSIFSRLKQLRSRSKSNIAVTSARRILSRLYVNGVIRKIVSFWYSPRQPEQWIFVIGCYNSGTTILRDVLCLHSDICGLPKEGAKLTGWLPRPEDRGWSRLWVGCPEYMDLATHTSVSDQVRKSRIEKDWAIWWDRQSRYFLEKSVSNTTRIEWIYKHFKNPKIIAITRDPVAVVEGIRRKARPSDKVRSEIGADIYPVDLVVSQWCDANERIIRSIKNGIPIHLVHYEQFVADPHKTLDGILDHIGISDRHYKQDSGSLLVSNKRIELSNMNSRSYESFSNEECKAIRRDTAELRQALGYEAE